MNNKRSTRRYATPKWIISPCVVAMAAAACGTTLTLFALLQHSPAPCSAIRGLCSSPDSFHFEFPAVRTRIMNHFCRCTHQLPSAPAVLLATSKCCLMQLFNSFALTYTCAVYGSGFRLPLSTFYFLFANLPTLLPLHVASDLLMQMRRREGDLPFAPLVLDRNVYGFYSKRADVIACRWPV